MAVVIPVDPGVPEQVMEITLDNEPIVLRVRWNGTAGLWFLDVWERDGKTVVATGLPVVGNARIGQGVAHPVFAGALVVVGANADPGLYDLGASAKLVHLTPSEVAIMGIPA